MDDPMSDSTQPGEPRVHLAGFRIQRLLGRGGMGSVYEAFQESMRRQEAVKILESTRQGMDDELRFEREAWVAGRLTHRHIVKVFDRGVDEGRLYLVMEFVEGGSLDDLIQAARRDPSGSATPLKDPRTIASMFAGVADALDLIHRNGIVHRDVKPSNLLWDPGSQRLLLTDFGLARD